MPKIEVKGTEISVFSQGDRDFISLTDMHAGFKNSAVKINVEQIFKLLSPGTEVKCI